MTFLMPFKFRSFLEVGIKTVNNKKIKDCKNINNTILKFSAIEKLIDEEE